MTHGREKSCWTERVRLRTRAMFSGDAAFCELQDQEGSA